MIAYLHREKVSALVDHAFATAMWLTAALVLACVPVHAPTTGHQRFDSPEGAAAALIGATRDHDTPRLEQILGPGSENVISSGDPILDKADRDRFIHACDEKYRVEIQEPGKAVLLVGPEEWPFPIPIVAEGGMWYFDTQSGTEEILNRRIGQNELKAIDTLNAYVDAQREYAAKDRNGDGVMEYAQKIASQPGKRDGLYWQAGPGEEQSPFGPLMADAAQEGYHHMGTPTVQPRPYHGYFYRILKGQGEHAPGGAYGYVVNGRMLFGFSLLAYPADYGSSGIMTFMVNQSGIVYEKDLGQDTGKIAGALEFYDPDQAWHKVDSD